MNAMARFSTRSKKVRMSPISANGRRTSSGTRPNCDHQHNVRTVHAQDEAIPRRRFRAGCARSGRVTDLEVAHEQRAARPLAVHALADDLGLVAVARLATAAEGVCADAREEGRACSRQSSFRKASQSGGVLSVCCSSSCPGRKANMREGPLCARLKRSPRIPTHVASLGVARVARAGV